MRELKFLPGSGVEYVHFIPVASEDFSGPKIFPESSPMVTFRHVQRQLWFDVRPSVEPVVSANVTRALKALTRNNVNSWDQLESLSPQDFRDWKNYGERAHAALIAICAENGVEIVSYPKW